MAPSELKPCEVALTAVSLKFGGRLGRDWCFDRRLKFFTTPWPCGCRARLDYAYIGIAWPKMTSEPKSRAAKYPIAPAATSAPTPVTPALHAENLPQTEHQLLSLSGKLAQIARRTRGAALGHPDQPAENKDGTDLTVTHPTDFSTVTIRSTT